MAVARMMAWVAAVGMIAAGCQAEREVLEQGATFDAPEEVRSAPLETGLGGERLGNRPGEIVATDTMEQVEITVDSAP